MSRLASPAGKGNSPLCEGVILTFLSSGQGWPLKSTQPREGSDPPHPQPFQAGSQKIVTIVQTQHLGLQQVRREGRPSPTGPAGGQWPPQALNKYNFFLEAMLPLAHCAQPCWALESSLAVVKSQGVRENGPIEPANHGGHPSVGCMW